MLTKKRGQIWIETVLYTLIGISLIALVLAFVSPRISEAKDRAVVEQTLSSLNDLDSEINSLASLPSGNRRVFEILMKRGELYILPAQDVIQFKISDLSKPYSQANATIKFGKIELISLLGNKTSSATMTLNYTGLVDIKYAGAETEKKFTQGATPYRFFLENRDIANGMRVISIESAS